MKKIHQHLFDSHSNQQINHILLNNRLYSIKQKHRNFYQVLGVKQDSTLSEIKCAFYDKSKRFHPDGSVPSAESFIELKTAYDTLRRPADRQLYDAQLVNSDSPFQNINKTRRNPRDSDFYNFYGGLNNNWNFWQQQSVNKPPPLFNNHMKFYLYIGFSLILVYNLAHWLRLKKIEAYYKNLIDKDEITKSFLRQRDVSGKYTESEFEQLAKLLRSNIDEAERLRLEHLTKQNPYEIREEARWINSVNNPIAFTNRALPKESIRENK